MLTCPHCGEEYEPCMQGGRNVRLYCSRRCQNRAREQRKAERKRGEFDRRVPCEVCREEFDRERPDHRYCSRRCYLRRYGQEHDGVGGGHKRRAEHYGVAYEPINPLQVYVEDEWTCGLCDEPIDPELAHPHPLSVSLDHKVPLSKGGPHVRSNVQAAHLLCNMRKGARVDDPKPELVLS